MKVGGDITVRGFIRRCVDLNCIDDEKSVANNTVAAGDRNDRFLMQTTGINIGADLTENVSTFVRLANESDWARDAATGGGATGTLSDFAVSQSYVTLKELFYSPLTVKVGRQPISWGRGFVLGSNLIPSIVNRTNDLHGSITANEFTDFTAFDAIRATLDLSNMGGLNIPLLADYVYIKLNEGSVGRSDDVTLQGVNFSTHLDNHNAEAETYWLIKRDRSTKNLTDTGGATTTPATDNFGSVNTIGVRGSAKPVEGGYVFGEIAYQFGRRALDGDAALIAGDAHQAWAWDLGVEYTLQNTAWNPKLGWEWIFWSGKDIDGAGNGWDPIARGYYTTALREFQTGANAGFYPTPQAGDTSAATNQHQFAWYGSINPIEDLTIAPRLTFFFLDESSTVAKPGKRRGYAGAEWDTNVVYNYTDDVQFGLLYALFAPGNIYRGLNDASSQELVTTVSVKF
ncbi:MAG: alginate export family protein [Candidatus Omnitrophica bacterium]|nr:alginate export family protein [Candidatus Omnitrophota bacterium]